CSWKLLTPGSVPAGARISAGKLGRVDRSLPKTAVSWVNLSPVSCIPSPESPAKRMITWSSSWTCLVTALSLLRTPAGTPIQHHPYGPGAECRTLRVYAASGGAWLCDRSHLNLFYAPFLFGLAIFL